MRSFVASLVAALALTVPARAQGDAPPVEEPAPVEEPPPAPEGAPPPAEGAPAPAEGAAAPVEETPADIAVPEPPAPLPPPEPVGYGYENGFFLQTPDKANRLRFRGLLQPRFVLAADDPDIATWSASFLVQRAQIELTGNVFTRALGFTLKTEFGQGQAFIKDAFMDGRVYEGLLLRAGVWKRPFSRQQLSSDWQLAFIDRSITDAAFAAGRDIGFAVQADVDRNPNLEWNVGVFSGATDRGRITGDVVVDRENGIGTLENVKVSNVPALFTPTFVARLGYNFGEVRGYSEMDPEGGPFRFGIAASVLEAIDLSEAGEGVTRAELDAIAKYEGITATGAVYASFAQQDPNALAQDVDKIGAHIQAGIMLFDAWHPALRYAAVQTIDGDLEQEVLANLTLLVFGQNVQVGGEVGSILDADGADVRVRLQGQVQF